MSALAGRKLRTVIANTQAVLAIELLVAAQALEWRVGMSRDPNAQGPSCASTGSDDELTGAFVVATAPAQRSKIAARLGKGTGAAYLAVRRVAEPMLADRVLEPDVRAVRRMISSGDLLAQVNAALDSPLRGIPALTRD